MSLRTKRNFKSLQLPDLAADGTPSSSESGAGQAPAPLGPAPTRLAPIAAPMGPAGPRRRPPPLGTEGVGPPIPQFMSPIDSAAGLNTAASSASNRRSAIQASITTQLAKMDLNRKENSDSQLKGIEIGELKDADLKQLAELGQGNGGSVVKAEHVPSGVIMAKKIVLIDAKPQVRKQILRELQIMADCKSPFIISSYGAFLADPNICICMEFMDKGSFDGIYKKIGPIDIEVVGVLAWSVLNGLMYLYDVHRIIHRDIKPSNILCNSEGQIKLCDFGVSGELINSIANTFVGTSVYMSPERIQGAEYSVKSDVWSLGITLIELARGQFPFASDEDSDDDDDNFSDLEDYPGIGGHKTTTQQNASLLSAASMLSPPMSGSSSTSTSTAKSAASDKTARRASHRRSRRRSKGVSLHGGLTTMSIIELMHHIVREPAPTLNQPGSSKKFRDEEEEFVAMCLKKEPEERGTPAILLSYAWMKEAANSTFDLKEWASTF